MEKPITIVSGRVERRESDPRESGKPAIAQNPGHTDHAQPGLWSANSGQVLGYARVSTDQQVIDRQIDALNEAGCSKVFTDRISGATSSRPELDALLAFARAHDVIVVLSLDRLGRDTRQLLTWVDELRERQIHLRILQLGVDTATPAGQMVLTVIAALAQMEREVLSQRVREGLASAKARGRIGGKPRSLTEMQRVEVQRLAADGRPTGEIAELFGVSPRTVLRARTGAR